METYGDGITRVLNLVFILDGTDNISGEDYRKECDFIRSCRDGVPTGGIDAEVRAVIVPTGGDVIGPMELSGLDAVPERAECDVGAMFKALPDILRRCERLGPDYVVDNLMVLVSDGRFLKHNAREYLQLTDNGRFRRTSRIAVCPSDDADGTVLADFTKVPDLVYGTDVFDRMTLIVYEDRIAICSNEPMRYDGPSEEANPHKLNRMNSEDSSDDVYDI
ncbi:MAG: hypothetical protein ACI4Q9_03460 [Candidatus Methanomethylophilaceae archaeon]